MYCYISFLSSFLPFLSSFFPSVQSSSTYYVFCHFACIMQTLLHLGYVFFLLFFPYFPILLVSGMILSRLLSGTLANVYALLSCSGWATRQLYLFPFLPSLSFSVFSSVSLYITFLSFSIYHFICCSPSLSSLITCCISRSFIIHMRQLIQSCVYILNLLLLNITSKPKTASPLQTVA